MDEAHLGSQRNPGPGDPSAQRQLLTEGNDGAVAVGGALYLEWRRAVAHADAGRRRSRGVGSPGSNSAQRQAFESGGHP